MQGVNVAIRATDEGFLDLVRTYLEPLRLPGKPERFLLFSADCGVRGTLPGGVQLRGRVRLYMNALLVHSGTVDEEAVGRLIGLLRDIDTNNSNEFIRVRGAAVALDGDAIAFPAEPSQQLPALAATLVRAGAGYLGDEVVNLDPVLERVHPLSLPLLLDAGDLPRFPELGREVRRRRPAAGSASARRPVRPDELGGSTGAPAPVRRLLFPEFRPGEPTSIEPVPAAAAVFALTRAALNLHVWEERALLFFRRLLEGIDVARLVVGDLDEACDLILGPSGRAGAEGHGRDGDGGR